MPDDSAPNNSSKPSPKLTFEVEAYIQQSLQLLELTVTAEQLPCVVENFERVHCIAQPVLDFPLSDDLEAAPQFEP